MTSAGTPLRRSARPGRYGSGSPTRARAGPSVLASWTAPSASASHSRGSAPDEDWAVRCRLTRTLAPGILSLARLSMSFRISAEWERLIHAVLAANDHHGEPDGEADCAERRLLARRRRVIRPCSATTLPERPWRGDAVARMSGRRGRGRLIRGDQLTLVDRPVGGMTARFSRRGHAWRLALAGWLIAVVGTGQETGVPAHG
jgi:hypothetical protein